MKTSNSICRLIIILSIVLITSKVAEAYPSYTSWTQSTYTNVYGANFTLRFRVSSQAVSGGKIRFEYEVYYTNGYDPVDNGKPWELYLEENNQSPTTPLFYRSGTFNGTTVCSGSGVFSDNSISSNTGSRNFRLRFRFKTFFMPWIMNAYTNNIASTLIADDQYESNNSFSTASNLNSNMSYGPLIISSNDDYYKVYVSSGYTISVNLFDFFNTAGDYNLRLYNPSQSYITGSFSNTNSETVSTVATGSGYYYFRVESNGSSPGFYSLDVSVSCPVPSQPGQITGDDDVCIGEHKNHSISLVNGATSYTWTYTGTPQPTGNLQIISWWPQTSGTLSVVASNACGSSTARTISITVSAVPSQPGAISGETNPCSIFPYTYSISSVSGADNYTWTYSGGGTPSGSGTSCILTPTSSGTLSVKANNTCGSSPARTKSLTVSTPPGQPGSISGNATVCQGSNNTYSIPSVSGADYYDWNLPSGWSGNSSTTSISTTAGSSGGTIKVRACDNDCGCGSWRELSVTVTPIPAQPGSISGTTTPCQGIQYTYSIASVSGATSYSWTYSGGGTCNSNGTNCTLTPTSSGTLSVTAQNSCGASSPRTLALTVITVPVQPGPISGETNPCPSIQYSYSITAVPGATSYTWAYSGGGTPSGTGTTCTLVPTSNGTLSVSANNACGSSTPRTLALTLVALPAQPGVITGEANPCTGIQYTYSIATVSGTSSYTWSYTGSGTPSGTGTSCTLTPTSSGTLSVTANNACGSSSASSKTLTVKPLPQQPGPISGNTSVCQGSNNTYSITAVAGADYYEWSWPTGWTGSSTSTAIITVAGGSSGTVKVRACSYDCGCGPWRELPITVISIPAQPGNISGNQAPCQGSQYSYSIAAVSGASSYTWTYSGGGTPTGTGTSCTLTPTSSGTLSVTANNSCGSSTARTLAIAVVNLPAQPGSISGEPNPCTGNSYTYSITAVPGASSYAWSYSGTGTPAGTGISCTLIPTSSGNLSVMAVNACGNSPSSNKSLTINTVPGPVGSITLAGGVCEGTSYTASVSPVQGATSYTWTLPPGWTGNSTTNTISGTVGSAGIIIVSANNACGAGPVATRNVVPDPLPTPVAVIGSGTFCNTATLTTTGGSGGTIYWQGTTSNGTSTTTPSTSQTITTSGTYYFRAKNACGWGQQGSATVTIKTAPPPIPDPISGPVNPCINSETSYSTNPVTDAIAYNWSYTGGGTPSGSGSSCTLIPTSGGILSVAATNVCGAGSARQLTLSPVNLPPQPGVIIGSNTPASGGTYIYEISPVSSAASYTWFYSGTGTLNPSTTTSCTLVPTGNGTLSVAALNACGTGQASTLALTMSLLPAPPDSIYGTPIPCFGTPYTYTIQPVNGAISYEWRFTVQGSGTTNTVGTGLTCILSPSSSGTLSVFAINNAGSSQAKTLAIQLITAPTRPNLIQGPTDPCLGIANQYMVDPVPYATHYTWTWSGGGTITGTSNQCILIPSTNGILAVIAHNTCGTSQDRTKALGLSYIPPLPGIISGQPTPYSIPYNYQIDPVTYATSYAWSYTGQGTLVENGTGCTLTPFTSGVLSVRAINGCGASNARTKAIDVIPTPGTPGPITGSSSPCAGTSQTYLISSVPLALSYYWSFTGGGVPISPGTSCTFTPTSSGILSVVASNLSGASTASSFEITIQALPIQPGSISGPNSVSPGAQPSYSITPMSGITSYSWSLPTSWTGSSTTSTITPTVGNIGGQVCVTAHNGCGQGPSRCVEVSLAAANQYTISGMLRYKNNLLSPIGSSSIRLFDSNNTLIATSTTNASGSFQFTGLANNTYTLAPSLTKPWGGVTAMDLTRYRQVIANIDTIAPMSQFHKKAGDVNKSNHLSITDLIWMRNRISFNVDSFPAGDWLYDSTEVVVQGANVSRNIYALCFGDGNGSFTPAAKSSFPELLQSSSQIMTVTDPNYITLPLIVNKGIDVASITMDIEYRDDLLNFIEASVSQYNQELVYHQVGNKIRLVFSSLSPLSTGAGNALASLSFKSNLPLPQNPVQAISSVQAELGDLANQQIQGVYISVPKIAGGISTNIENFLPAYDFKVYPNPFNDYLEVTFSLNVPSEVIIEMFDYAGKLIQRKALSTLKADKHHFLLNTSTYEDGVYFIKLRTRSDHDEFNQVKRAILISK